MRRRARTERTDRVDPAAAAASQPADDYSREILRELEREIGRAHV